MILTGSSDIISLYSCRSQVKNIEPLTIKYKIWYRTKFNINTKDSYKIIHLNSNLNKLEKQEQDKPKAKRRYQIVKMITQINKIKNRKKMTKLM